jgi:hypothetical protein
MINTWFNPQDSTSLNKLSEEKDEKIIEFFSNRHFVGGFLRRCHSKGKNCSINRA